MGTRDRDHFNVYTQQNRVKHKILSAYLPAYFNALKSDGKRFHYIDGFAGPGHYEQSIPGSPLLVLDKIADAGVTQRTAISCVEDYRPFFDQLVSALSAHPVATELYQEPFLVFGEFHAYINEILSQHIYGKDANPRNTATFAFVDPCGISGVHLSDLSRVLRLPYGECLLFFNYDGINRLVGGVEAGTHDRTALANLLGETSRVDSLLAAVRGKPPSEREVLVRDHFIAALRMEAGTKYFVPFAVESAERNRTSHYLIHCSGHSLAYKIMKHVMYTASNARADDYGRLVYLRADELGQQLSFFRQDIDECKAKIIRALEEKQRQVKYFRDEWVRRPDDPFSANHYATMLIALEEEGRIEVFDKHNKTPRPAEKRQRKGQTTIGEPLWLRLRG